MCWKSPVAETACADGTLIRSKQATTLCANNCNSKQQVVVMVCLLPMRTPRSQRPSSEYVDILITVKWKRCRRLARNSLASLICPRPVPRRQPISVGHRSAAFFLLWPGLPCLGLAFPSRLSAWTCPWQSLSTEPSPLIPTGAGSAKSLQYARVWCFDATVAAAASGISAHFRYTPCQLLCACQISDGW